MTRNVSVMMPKMYGIIWCTGIQLFMTVSFIISEHKNARICRYTQQYNSGKSNITLVMTV